MFWYFWFAIIYQNFKKNYIDIDAIECVFLNWWHCIQVNSRFSARAILEIWWIVSHVMVSLLYKLNCFLSDYSKGFGGKFGIQTDRVDKSAVGFDHLEKVSKHESQRGWWCDLHGCCVNLLGVFLCREFISNHHHIRIYQFSVVKLLYHWTHVDGIFVCR